MILSKNLACAIHYSISFVNHFYTSFSKFFQQSFLYLYSISIWNLFSFSFSMNFTDCNHFSMSLSLSYWNITGSNTPKVMWIMLYGFLANLIRFSPMQKVRKSVKIWQSCREHKSGNFFETQCIINTGRCFIKHGIEQWRGYTWNKIISKLCQTFIAAREYFPTCSLNLIAT